jgi:dimethylargininase
MVRALVRSIPQSFGRALSAVPPEPPIDVELARAQHEAYRAALAACGAQVDVLAADDGFPDCCFVEDTAVVDGEVALITRPGAPSRRGEVEAVAATLSCSHQVVRMEAPATLDGGDCLRTGDAFYVSSSSRTNDAGIAALARAFPHLRVVTVEMPPGILHLKCVCSPLGDGRIALAVDSIPARTFAAEVVWISAAETYAANLVAIGRNLIIAEGYPLAAEALSRAGFYVLPVPCSEVRKADGSLTCQSILYR